MGKYYLPLSHLHKVASLQKFSPFQVRQVERKKKKYCSLNINNFINKTLKTLSPLFTLYKWSLFWCNI